MKYGRTNFKHTEVHTKGQTHTVSTCSVTYGRGLTGLSRFKFGFGRRARSGLLANFQAY